MRIFAYSAGIPFPALCRNKKEVTALKVAKFFAVIFAIAGIVLLLGSCVICLASVNSSVKILEYPDRAADCSQQLLDAVSAGDYPALESLLYGTPSLGTDPSSVSARTQALWNGFRSNMTLTYSGNLYLLDSMLARDGVLTVPDIPAILEKAEAAARQMLTLPEGSQVSAQQVEQALDAALTQVFQGEVPTTSHTVTVKFFLRDGQWWAVPDQTFLQAISGQQF